MLIFSNLFFTAVLVRAPIADGLSFCLGGKRLAYTFLLYCETVAPTDSR